MNSTQPVQKSSGGGLDWEVLFPLVLAVIVGAIAVTSQSFWMDEASTGITAMQPTFGAWWHSLLFNGGSNTQMPFYMFYVWVWEKIFDPTEWTLRASNLPWLALGFLAIPRRQGLFLLTLAASPFLWYYLNEFRPYIMQVSASLIMLGSVWRLAEMPAEQKNKTPEKFWTTCYVFGSVLLCGSSLLGVIWTGAGAGATLAVLGWPRVWQLLRRCRLIVLLAAPPLLALAVFYLRSLQQGDRAVIGSTGLGNAAFVAYELAGFSGLGPGRIYIRSDGAAAFRPFLAPLLTYAGLLACVLFAGVQFVFQKSSRRVWLGVAAALFAAVGLLFAVGVVTHFRVLGRHFTPLAPCVLLLIAFGLRNLEERGGWRRVLAILFLLLSLVSALSLRFCERHAKDDNRTAAVIANQAKTAGKIVWWCADGGSGLFYAVPLARTKPGAVAPEMVWWVNDSTAAEWLTNATPPDLVLLSKPELHDVTGHTRDFLKRNHYQLSQTFQAFTVWQKP